MLVLFVDHHNRRHYHSPPSPTPPRPFSLPAVHVHRSDVVSILKEIILAKRETGDETEEKDRTKLGAVNAASTKTEPGLTTFLTFYDS
jgi:hypothetical protein